MDIIHPDMLSSGGLTETKRIADHAERFGIPTALHACCSPVGFMANVHLAASIASLVAVEHHGLDLPFFRNLVTGLDEDYMADGYVAVPDKPGLGIDLNSKESAASCARARSTSPTRASGTSTVSAPNGRRTTTEARDGPRRFPSPYRSAGGVEGGPGDLPRAPPASATRCGIGRARACGTGADAHCPGRAAQ